MQALKFILSYTTNLSLTSGINNHNCARSEVTTETSFTFLTDMYFEETASCHQFHYPSRRNEKKPAETNNLLD